MAKLSDVLLPTLRDAPADAEALSHQLMVRAGLIRQLGAGLWSWLPAGFRAHQKAAQIIREEQDAIGAQEMLMPVLMPAEPWRRTGRYDIDELLKLQDRKGADLVLAITHEEAVTTHVAQVVRSYRDLPLMLYHLQTKERDEPRPRAGVLRTREFVMKDAYSFDRDEEGLEESYERQREAYDRTFDRAGLRWYRVESDPGMMGGSGAHEYMAPCPAGENEVALAPGYAANVEVASARPRPVPPSSLTGRLATPGLKTLAEAAAHVGADQGQCLRTFALVTPSLGRVALFLRGDHRLEEAKLRVALGEDFRPAHPDELWGASGSMGFPDPDLGIPVLVDEAVGTDPAHPWITGANEDGFHLGGVAVPEGARTVDVRRVEAGDTTPSGHAIEIEPAIEVGNIFKLGTRYSGPLGATYLDEQGKERLIQMGCYGIGPARIVAAAVEQHADERGISWPRALAPWDVHVVGLGKAGSEERAAAAALAAQLEAAGLAVLEDDRDAGTGEKLTDAELLGLPLRLTVGRRSREAGVAEAQARRGGRDLDPVPLEGAAEAVAALWADLP